MQPVPSQSLEILFILLTFFLVGITIFAVAKFSRNRRKTLMTFLVIFLWLVFLTVISGLDFFHEYNSLPPRIMIAPLGCLVAIVILSFSKSFSSFLKKVPMHWLVYIQSFRIVMELILYLLAEEGTIPEQMSFAGLNFDILSGLTALLIGWMVKNNKISRNALIGWNIAGILLLLNIVAIAALSTPYPFAVFKEEPLNTIIFYFPFVWLPGFVAPYALAMHVFSIKKMRSEM